MKASAESALRERQVAPERTRGLAQFEGTLTGRLARQPDLYGSLIVAGVFVVAVVVVGLLGDAAAGAAGLEKDVRGAVASLGTDVVAVALLAWILSRPGRWEAVGFAPPSEWRSLKLLAFPAVFAFASGAAGFAFLDTSKAAALALAAPQAFLTGLWEEGLIRGFLLSMFLVAALRSDHGPRRAVVASAVIFGLMHLAGLVGGGAPSAVLLQVVYATLFGIGFGALLLRTNALWLLVALHGLFDLEHALPGEVPEALPAIVVLSYVIMAVYGLFLLRRVKEPSPAPARPTEDEVPPRRTLMST